MSTPRLAFPANPRRPQATGRGERETQVTPGLKALQDQQKKNKEKADKAKATRQANRAAAGAPLTPTTAQNRPPLQTPLPHPAQATPPAPSSNFRPRVGPGASPSATQHSSSPFAVHHSSPLGPRLTAPSGLVYTSTPPSSILTQARTPSTSVPQHYEPTYPDYSSGLLRPSVHQNYEPQYHDYRALATPDADGLNLISAAHFRAMMQTLDPEAQAQMQDIVNMKFPASADSGQPGDQSEFEFMGSDGAAPAGEEEDAPAAGARHDDNAGATDGHDNGAGDEELWNTPQDDDDDDLQVHANAQSSLQVEVHDVVVRRKQKRKRNVVQADTDTEDAPPSGKSRKKRSGHRQVSRSVKDLPTDRRRIVEAGFTSVQKAICLTNPWPTASPSGDPAADDDEFEEIIENAWDDGVDDLGLEPESYNAKEMSTKERNLASYPLILLRSRIPQVRGSVMTEADKLVTVCFKFVDVTELSDPTLENIAAAEEKNRQLVADLEGCFMYKVPTDTSDIGTIGRHCVFQRLLNAAFFAEKGTKRRAFYFAGMDELPLETFGLFMDAVVCGIDRWKTGRHKVVDFDAEQYGRIHKDSMTFLQAWVSEYQRDVHPVNLAQQCLRDLLTNARKLVEVPAEKNPSRHAMFPLHVFSAQS
ncbi:hypothetical protein B0H16DRAFT_1859527 [Mycena metata]|uniref:DUF6532 domain-containing protein n=1 Tax=Mycena metata TaxID=1033252 RepID=A0AAD7N360_9AGAR|nr:hypothetical protein B0H16DRAFT_1859527 [Mycena metata]